MRYLNSDNRKVMVFKDLSETCKSLSGLTGSKKQHRLKTTAVCVTIEQLDQRRDNARFCQHGGTGVVHGNCSDHYHHLQDEVILC